MTIRLDKTRVAVFPKGYMEELCSGAMPLLEWIKIAGTLGVDGLELYPGFVKDTSAKGLSQIGAAARDAGLLIPMMCSSPDFTNPQEAERRREIDKMKAMIDFMAELGPSDFRSCRVLSGQNRPGITSEDGIRWTVECIGELLPYAEQHRVYLVMENHYKDGFWTYPEFAQSSERFLAIIGQIESPWFGVNFDPSNALLAGEDPLELLSQVKHRVVSMHASDRYLKAGYTMAQLENYSQQGYSEALAHGVIGQGLNDYDRIFQELDDAGFRGWISIEDGVNGLEELRESARFLHRQIKQYHSADEPEKGSGRSWRI